MSTQDIPADKLETYLKYEKFLYRLAEWSIVRELDRQQWQDQLGTVRDALLAGDATLEELVAQVEEDMAIAPPPEKKKVDLSLDPKVELAGQLLDHSKRVANESRKETSTLNVRLHNAETTAREVLGLPPRPPFALPAGWKKLG